MTDGRTAERKIGIVTGATSGIGRAAARQLVEHGATVVMPCRDVVRGEAVRAQLAEQRHGELVVMPMDVSDQASIRAFARAFLARFERLDALINNAATFDLGVAEPRIGADGHEVVWATNHLGPVLLTQLLLDRIRASGGRVINVSTKGLAAHPFLHLDWDDPDSRGAFSTQRAYYRSKLAQCLFTRELARRLAGTGATANAVRVPAVQVPDERLPDIHPVLLWIYRLKRRLALSPEQMAETYTWLALSEEAGALNGQHVDEQRRRVSFPSDAMDDAQCGRLWELSNKGVGLPVASGGKGSAMAPQIGVSPAPGPASTRWA